MRPGGKWSSAGVSADGKPFSVDGEYLEVDRPRLLVYTWNPSFAHKLKTTVRFELEPSTACIKPAPIASELERW